MLNRLINWKTTAAGAAGTAIVWYAFSSLGCQVPTNGWFAWAATLIPVILGAISKDK